jgi:hypothetical protein
MGEINGLGRPQWTTPVPTPGSVVWQFAKELKARAKRHGVPEIGQVWYCGWRGHREPNYSDPLYTRTVDTAMRHLAPAIADVKTLLTVNTDALVSQA